MRVLVSAIASITLIIAGALVMDWYQVPFSGVVNGAHRIALDLRNVHICDVDHVCVIAPLTPLRGMFPTLASVTLWSSLGFAALITFQAGARVLTGNANDSFTKSSYMLALTTISLAIATAYVFHPELEGPGIELVEQTSVALHRTWAPLTLLVGHVVGFATLYMAVAPESSDLSTAYMPVSPALLASARAIAGDRTKTPPAPIAPPASTGPAESIGTIRANAPLPPSSQSIPAFRRAKTGTIPPAPEHLRNRFSYVALTAELTAGGIDARREDGSSRLILWRDVVGIVARRMPPAYDNVTFIDIVSTAGSTLRIMPWTRLTGEPIDAEGDARPRSIALRAVALCPEAKLDSATRQFLDTGEAAQLPDHEALRAHDERLA